MPLYAATIFLGSFLLFLVQPLVARQMLPWFGGASSVWTTCLLFFQFALLAGYAYADVAIRRLSPRARLAVHVVALAASLLWLPIMADPSWKPTGEENPLPRILGFLAATIGLPFVLLSANGPLTQALFARRFPAASPYRLFALSNLASLLALLGYPVLIEPWFTTATQVWAWSIGYAAFALVIVVAVWRDSQLATATPATATAPVASDDGPAPSLADYAGWTGLAALGSIVLMGISNHLTQDVASVPLLWVVPLAIYLVTFILCFERDGIYKPKLYAGAFAALIVIFTVARIVPALKYSLPAQVAIGGALLFVACMVCHRQLVARRPARRAI